MNKKIALIAIITMLVTMCIGFKIGTEVFGEWNIKESAITNTRRN